MPEIVKERITHHVMKMRLYPAPEQAEKIGRIFRALQLAYNITFHAVFCMDPAVCEEPKADGAVWPSYKKMAKALWRHALIEKNAAIAEAPAGALMTNEGIFLRDARRAWETGMHDLPINKADRKDFRFYHAGKPRRSFLVQMACGNLVPSPDNPKVAWVTVQGVPGRMKARGFDRKLWFGADGAHAYEEAVMAGEVASNLTVCVSQDPCGDYYISVRFSIGKKGARELYREARTCASPAPIGLDVGIKDIAITSEGIKYPNLRSKQRKGPVLERMSRQLSRRWGPANPSFRDYNKAVRQANRVLGQGPPKPLAQPSRGYLAVQRNRARLERRIARQRESYYHQVTAELVRRASMLAVETLHVKNMMQNHRLAYALGDAAMSDFLGKLRYKAERSHVPLIAVGMFEPTSQRCSVCGAQNEAVKSLAVRRWVCPSCGAEHDRDINAARNILTIAQTTGPGEDKAKKDTEPRPKRGPRRPRAEVVFADRPQIVVRFSPELTKLNDPRYLIVDKETGAILDDAQGAGYRSITKAKNCYKAKATWSKKRQETP